MLWVLNFEEGPSLFPLSFCDGILFMLDFDTGAILFVLSFAVGPILFIIGVAFMLILDVGGSRNFKGSY